MEGIITSTLKNTVRAYPGCRIGFRLTSKETSDALAIMDMQVMPGAEPPRHYHLWEDETIILHKGTATFFVGDDIINAKAGDIIFMPRTIPHHFVVTSANAHCTLIVTPGGLEHFFEEATFSFDESNVPSPGKTVTMEARDRISKTAEKFGIRFL